MPETFGLPGMSGTSVAREFNHAIANQSTEYVILFVTFTSTHGHKTLCNNVLRYARCMYDLINQHPLLCTIMICTQRYVKPERANDSFGTCSHRTHTHTRAMQNRANNKKLAKLLVLPTKNTHRHTHVESKSNTPRLLFFDSCRSLSFASSLPPFVLHSSAHTEGF